LLLLVAIYALRRYAILTISTDAVVVTNFIEVSAPIEGFVRHAQDVMEGKTVAAHERLCTVENPHVDRTALADLQSRLQTLDGDVQSLEVVVQALDRLGGRFETRGNDYQQRRARQMDLLVLQSQSRIEADQARLAESQSRFRRMQRMADAGLTSPENAEGARRDATVAEQSLAGSRHEMEGLVANVDALKKGFSVSDLSAMDRSYSGQRRDEITLRLVQLRGELNVKRAQRPALAEQLKREQAQVDALATATLETPRRGRVWSVEAADGRFVMRGAPIVRLIDCSHLDVLAYLPPWQYDRVRIGDEATITVLATKQRFQGKVSLRLGSPESRLSRAGALTVPPDQRQRYAVLVSSLALTTTLGATCDVGENVEVRFK